jgi:endonuclease YncB( thermonuclease family)
MHVYRATITGITDGDTFDAEVDVGFYHWTRQRFRLLGYNAPETRGDERPLGEKAKLQLNFTLMGRAVILRSHRGDAFGRWLADVALDTEPGQDLVERLIREGWGVRWDGKGERPRFDPALPYPLVPKTAS